MKYVYCLVGDMESTSSLPPGLGGMKVYQVSAGRVTALVSDVDPGSVIDTTQNALTHHEVVQTALRLASSVIPCRFGTVLHDEGKIMSLLKTCSTQLDARLARVRDKVEMSVSVIVDGITTPAIGRWETNEAGEHLPVGERYLSAKRAQYEVARAVKEQAECLRRELNEVTTPLWTEVKVQRRFIDDGLLLNLYYLVDREKLSTFYHVYQQFTKRWPGIKFLYTGPWPPYSFTEFSLLPRKPNV